ncbi:hypothetical protein BU25DRAFT_46416 [Macroventuria anomochaeta]|uniref:Uncharacterized protein n=1 Tax=Macroventuria anomochaeta TaxID=301207 RepID=A0ACB6S306_9PLEO|nr:uncharacterized protein BU25DRAFT_46416 [Macroventuria anomochaeta]KAF2627912.1 hypothetical protein BU25DRAFT_46416 [Macroventuria anomochaeta]
MSRKKHLPVNLSFLFMLSSVVVFGVSSLVIHAIPRRRNRSPTFSACALHHALWARSCDPIHNRKGATTEAVSMVRRTVRRGTQVQCTSAQRATCYQSLHDQRNRIFVCLLRHKTTCLIGGCTR